MNTLEKITEMTNEVEFDLTNARDEYHEAEVTLVKIISDWVKGSKVSCVSLGSGIITEAEGTTLDNLIVTIAFDTDNKRFSLPHIMSNAKFIKFVELDVTDIWNKAYAMHTEWTTTYKELVRAAEQLAVEAEKKAAAEKKAEEKYQKQKEKAIRDFDELVKKPTVLSNVDEFYYALGWLTKHAGTVSATLPDYLEEAFIKYFGNETGCRIIDSRHRGPAGWQSQWSWSFRISLKKFDSIPSLLVSYLNPAGKAITSTVFIWELIDDYGFQFGKKQDVDKIVQTVPAKYIESFNEGLAA